MFNCSTCSFLQPLTKQTPSQGSFNKRESPRHGIMINCRHGYRGCPEARDYSRIVDLAKLTSQRTTPFLPSWRSAKIYMCATGIARIVNTMWFMYNNNHVSTWTLEHIRSTEFNLCYDLEALILNYLLSSVKMKSTAYRKEINVHVHKCSNIKNTSLVEYFLAFVKHLYRMFVTMSKGIFGRDRLRTYCFQ